MPAETNDKCSLKNLWEKNKVDGCDFNFKTNTYRQDLIRDWVPSVQSIQQFHPLLALVNISLSVPLFRNWKKIDEI